jgi:hypothetical protein
MRNDELDQIIEKSFKAESMFRLSDNFAQKVTNKLIRNEQWKNDLKEYLFLTVVLLTLFAAVTGFYFYIDKQLILKAFSFVTKNLIPVILILFLLNFILFADRVLLRLLFSRWKRT